MALGSDGRLQFRLLMRFVALVSGGKDSCHAMALAIQHGHELVCLGNLLPPTNSPDELDSFMYQTVGHQLVAAYAECMGLPLYRGRIKGSARSHGLQYQRTDGDEVEDLHALLSYVKAMVPGGIDAVTSGAIASDYQRLRVEEVCSRLGLVSLAYLWHQPQQLLLRDMIESGIEAILVKVAALGLDPHRHLGKSLANLEPYLIGLAGKYGCNVCGEGGEYESLVLDCPLFKWGRIVLDKGRVVVSEESSADSVGYLDPTTFHIELKQKREEESGPGGKGLLCEIPADWDPPPVGLVTAARVISCCHRFDIQLSVRQGIEFTQISAQPICSMIDSSSTAGREASTPEDTAEAIHQAMAAIIERLAPLSLNVQSKAIFVHLYLSDMSHFSIANAAYSNHFPSLNPPSRACLQTPLPPGCPLIIDILLSRQQDIRKVLHVQSISSWAPSCIGPYSQANVHRGLIHMAGQIPLDPATMAVIEPLRASEESNQKIPSELRLQTRRALESCEAVAVCLRASVLRASLGLTVYIASEASTHGDSPEKEVAGVISSGLKLGCIPTDDLSGAVDESLLPFGNLDPYLLPPLVSSHETITVPSVVVITADSLPRGSLVEIQPLAIDLAFYQSQRIQEDAESSDEEDSSLGLAAAWNGLKVEAIEHYQSNRISWSRCSYLSRGIIKLSRCLFYFKRDEILKFPLRGSRSDVDEIVKEEIDSLSSSGMAGSIVRAMAWFTSDVCLISSSSDSLFITTWIPVCSLWTSECQEGCSILVEVILEGS